MTVSWSGNHDHPRTIVVWGSWLSPHFDHETTCLQQISPLGLSSATHRTDYLFNARRTARSANLTKRNAPSVDTQDPEGTNWSLCPQLIKEPCNAVAYVPRPSGSQGIRLRHSHSPRREGYYYTAGSHQRRAYQRGKPRRNAGGSKHFTICRAPTHFNLENICNN